MRLRILRLEDPPSQYLRDLGVSLPKRLQDGGSRETGVPLITNWKLCLKEINIFCFISTSFFLSVVLYSENRSGSILLVVKPKDMPGLELNNAKRLSICVSLEKVIFSSYYVHCTVLCLFPINRAIGLVLCLNK